jgi:uncharacterized protein YeeX (DUF496 family)
MTPQHDPEVEELIAASRERKRNEQQARDDEKHCEALIALAALCAMEAGEDAAKDARVAAMREELDRVQAAYIALAAMSENRRNNRHSQKMMLWATLACTMPATWREARAYVESHILAEQERRFTCREAGALAEPRILGLFIARDQLDQLCTTPVEKIPQRIKEILAAIPPRWEDGPVPIVPFVERASAGIRDYIKSRMTGNTN